MVAESWQHNLKPGDDVEADHPFEDRRIQGQFSRCWGSRFCEIIDADGCNQVVAYKGLIRPQETDHEYVLLRRVADVLKHCRVDIIDDTLSREEFNGVWTDLDKFLDDGDQGFMGDGMKINHVSLTGRVEARVNVWDSCTGQYVPTEERLMVLDSELEGLLGYVQAGRIVMRDCRP